MLFLREGTHRRKYRLLADSRSLFDWGA